MCNIPFWKSCSKYAVPMGEREQTAGERKHGARKARRAMHHHDFEKNWGQGMFVGVIY
jgi:hypothetical protein